MRVTQRRESHFRHEIEFVRHIEEGFLQVAMAGSGIHDHIVELLAQKPEQLVRPASTAN